MRSHRSRADVKNYISDINGEKYYNIKIFQELIV